MKHYAALFFALVLLAAGCSGKGEGGGSAGGNAGDVVQAVESADGGTANEENTPAIADDKLAAEGGNDGNLPIVIGGFTTEYTLNNIGYHDSILIVIAEYRSKDLSGIEQLADAQINELNLVMRKDVKEIDLTPLNHLKRLEGVYLEGRGVTEIPDFSSIPSIRQLKIDGGSLTSLDGIETMPSLESMGLSNNKERLPDISALRHLQNLKRLTIYDNPSTLDCSVLKDLPALEVLTVGKNVDLTGISDLKSLQTLVIVGSEGSIANLEEIGRMPWLESLDIDYLITSVEFLSNLTNLEFLEIWAGRYSENYREVFLPLDVSPLKNLTNLKRLYLRGFDLQNAEVFDQLPNLESFETGAYPDG